MQPNFNYNYQRPTPNGPPQQQPAQSPPMQQNSPQPPQSMYQQQMNHQMRYNPQMMYQMMRGQMPVSGMPPNYNQQQQMAAAAQINSPRQQMPQQMQQMSPQLQMQQQQYAAQMQHHQQMQQQQQLQQQQQMQMQQQQQQGRAQYNYSQYSARMPFQIQQYQQPYKKAPTNLQRPNNVVNVKSAFIEPKKPVIPPPKPINPPAHIPSARQVGIKLLQPVADANEPTLIHKKSKQQAHILLKDELLCLFRSIDRKRCFYKFANEFDTILNARTKLLSTFYDKQKLQLSLKIDTHAAIAKDIGFHHTQYNISQPKIIKDIKDVGYKLGNTADADKSYFARKRNSRMLPCRWIGLHERPNMGRRLRLPIVDSWCTSKFVNKSNTSLAPIRLNIDMDGLAIADTFTWDITNASNSLSLNVTPELFAYLLIEDLKYPMHKDVVDKVVEQISNGIEDYMLGNISQKEPTTPVTNDLRIRIKINTTIGFVSLEDEFEWDIYNNDNSPEEFAEILAIELHLGGEFITAIAHSIREQCFTHLKALNGVNYTYDGRLIAEFDTELANFFCPIIDVNTLYRQVPAYPDYHISSYDQMLGLEKERERENRYQKRKTRTRRNVLPEKEPLKTWNTSIHKMTYGKYPAFESTFREINADQVAFDTPTAPIVVVDEDSE